MQDTSSASRRGPRAERCKALDVAALSTLRSEIEQEMNNPNSKVSKEETKPTQFSISPRDTNESSGSFIPSKDYKNKERKNVLGHERRARGDECIGNTSSNTIEVNFTRGDTDERQTNQPGRGRGDGNRGKRGALRGSGGARGMGAVRGNRGGRGSPQRNPHRQSLPTSSLNENIKFIPEINASSKAIYATYDSTNPENVDFTQFLKASKSQTEPAPLDGKSLLQMTVNISNNIDTEQTVAELPDISEINNAKRDAEAFEREEAQNNSYSESFVKALPNTAIPQNTSIKLLHVNQEKQIHTIKATSWVKPNKSPPLPTDISFSLKPSPSPAPMSDLSLKPIPSPSINVQDLMHLENRERVAPELSYENANSPSKSTKQTRLDKEYEEYKALAAAVTDYSEISKLNIIYLSGKDSLGRQVIVTEISNLLAKKINLEMLLYYCIHVLDPIVNNDYVLVVIGTNAKSENRPNLDWLKKAYSIFNRKYKKNLKSLFFVHANRWMRATLTLLRPFVSNKFWKKVVYIENIEDIYKSIDRSQITFPNYVIRYNTKINSRPPTFGSSIQQVLKTEHSKTNIPDVVQKSIAFLHKCYHVEGLFRHSGLVSHIDDLKQAFNRGEEVELADDEDPHAVAGLLKHFFRELPDPLFTYDLHDAFLQIQVSMGKTEDAWVATIRNLLVNLPVENLRVLQVLMDLIVKISQHSDRNLMSSKNLAIVFGPTLFRSRDPSGFVAMQEAPVTNSLVRKMIENYDLIFNPSFEAMIAQKQSM